MSLINIAVLNRFFELDANDMALHFGNAKRSEPGPLASSRDMVRRRSRDQTQMVLYPLLTN